MWFLVFLSKKVESAVKMLAMRLWIKDSKIEHILHRVDCLNRGVCDKEEKKKSKTAMEG